MPDSEFNPPPPAAPRTRRRKRGWPQILLWSAGGLLALILITACTGVLWLRSAAKTALPTLDGDLHLAGLSAPVIVRRDAHGVPHIEATTQDDLFLAQGYVTAQDRLWQMDASRRNANGELAEILGSSVLKHDKMQRVLQIRVTAQRIYAKMPAADRARLDDYARGVNLYIAQHAYSLPPEFRLLGYRPQPWSGVDSVSIGLMMAQMLDTHWDVKLSRDHIAAKLNNPKLEADLYPVGSWRDHPPTGIKLNLNQPRPAPPPSADSDEEDDRTQTNLAPFAAPNSLDAPSFSRSLRKGWDTSHPNLDSHEDPQALRELLGLPACANCTPGSNNWVIDGHHTASGKPLLANDMHLPLSAPDVWYIADLKAPGYHSAGVTAPGIPCIIAGHNEHVAWGFTALYADVQDLYIEELDHKGNYQANDTTWKPLAVDHEIIKVRFGKDVLVDVRSTDHGPLLNPIFTAETRPIALKWTLYDPSLNALPFYALNTASNWTEFSAALGDWAWLTLNTVYSDDQGHIAYHAVGKVPIRWDGHWNFDKPLQYDPLNLRNEWHILTPTDRKTPQGGTVLNLELDHPYIPFDQMPNGFDPPSGFLATANSRVSSYKFPISLTHEWVEPYRIERIYKSLEGREHLTPADMLAMQTDVYSEVDQELGHRFAYAIDHTSGADARLRNAADLMRSWDGKLTTDSAAASIVTHTRYALWPLILEPKLGKEAKEYRWGESNFAEEEIIMHANADWLPLGYKNWDELLTDAVRKGMDSGKAPSDIARWSYGSWHKVDIEHPLAQFLPLIGHIAGTGPQPQSGDTTTVKQVGHAFGPSQRFTMDWSNIDSSTENIVLGESGNPYSLYFRDQWNAWYGGTTCTLPFTDAAVTAQTQHTLRLLP